MKTTEKIVDGSTSQIAGGRGYSIQHEGCKSLNCTKGKQPKLNSTVTCKCGTTVKIIKNTSIWD